jgi:hypothetical protein
MSSQLDHIRPVAVPGRVSQGTAIEQSRAIAQVQAMVIVAQQCPRSVPAAIAAMEEACRQRELAKRAFFRFPRAGETVSGPSVHLARELARCWGNIEHGVTELRRDDLASESEMQAFAWDLETNTRSASIFIVPHKRDTKSGVRELTDMRDIYENNANNGARRLREAVFSVLPVWYRERAMALCQKTLEDGGGKPLAMRIADAVKAFERHRVTPGRMAAKFGYASVDELNAIDLAQLEVVFESLRQGTVTVDDEFPAETAGRPSAADITGQPKNVPPAAVQASPVPAEAAPTPAVPAGGTRPPQRASTGQVGMIRKKFTELYPGEETDTERLERLAQTQILARREESLGSTNELTSEQAVRVRKALDKVSTAAELETLIATGEVHGE